MYIYKYQTVNGDIRDDQNEQDEDQYDDLHEIIEFARSCHVLHSKENVFLHVLHECDILPSVAMECQDVDCTYEHEGIKVYIVDE